jgi:hypothetical protein
MGFLRRALGGGESAPGWAAFMGADEYRAFEDAVVADFAQRGITARVTDDGSVLAETGNHQNAYGLSNLAQLCHAIDRSDWPAAIRTHFGNLAGAERAHDQLADYAYARDLLKVRVYRTSELLPEALEGMVRQPLAAELVAVLAADLPTTVSTIGEKMAEAWGVPPPELFAAAAEHMADEVPGYEHKVVQFGAAIMHDLVGDSFFVASQIVRFADLADPPAGGALVALPNRHHLLWHGIESMDATVQLVQVMLQVAAKLYQDGPGSITPDLYWWRAGELTLLPSRIDGGQIQFAPPDAFVELLNRLA